MNPTDYLNTKRELLQAKWKKALRRSYYLHWVEGEWIRSSSQGETRDAEFWKRRFQVMDIIPVPHEELSPLIHVKDHHGDWWEGNINQIRVIGNDESD